MDPMSLMARQGRIQRRRALAGEWRSGAAADRAENELFDASFELAEKARQLELAAGQVASAPATAAALGCMTSALEAQATALLKMRSLVVHELSAGADTDAATEAQELGRLLYAISQNLRFATQASDLARSEASRMLGTPAAA